ncbi:MAG: 5-formyltetrahydrofolate cyclo-ligase [Deltaproteobacteria bacterium]|nr:MAG: 5-formyltetrahydrofolate cyclo-ligase [Deltaproteobacteria bacterium]
MTTGDAMAAEKARLRAELRRVAEALAPTERWTRSRRLVRAVLESEPWHTATAVVGFVGRGAEPDTRPVLEAALATGRPLLLPRVSSRRPPRLSFEAVSDLGVLEAGTFGIPEPPPGPGAEIPAGALVLVPAVALDAQGGRLGHGMGFYDRALADLSGAVTAMGLCLAPFLVSRVPTAGHDVRLDWIATDEGVVRVPQVS